MIPLSSGSFDYLVRLKHYLYAKQILKNNGVSYMYILITFFRIGQKLNMSRLMTKPTKWHSAPRGDSDQPEHPPILIKDYADRMKKAWFLSYPLNASEDVDQTGRMPRLI